MITWLCHFRGLFFKIISGLTMNTWRYECNREPKVAAIRAELCEMYRRIRRTNHALARGLWISTQSAYKLFSTALIDNSFNF